MAQEREESRAGAARVGETREAVNQAGTTAERASTETRNVASQTGEVAARDASSRAREMAERITEHTKETPEQAARHAREIAENFADSLARTTDPAVTTTERAAEQGRVAVWQGVRAAAGMQARLTDVGQAGEVAEELLQNTIGPEIESILSRLETSIPEERRAMNAVMARLIRG